MAHHQTESRSLYRTLFEDPDRMLAIYDQSVQELIEAVRPEGYFDGWDADSLVWPPSRSESGPIGLEGLLHRVRLVDAIYQGVPERRGGRLSEAHAQFARLTSAYHEGNRMYMQLKAQFVARGAGDEQEFLQLYQTFYLEALAKGDLFSPDAGEASLEQVRITRVPLSHAQAVAEALSSVDLDDDPRWEAVYACELDGTATEAPLRDLLRDVAQRTLELIAAGGLLSTRFNYLNNFAWFGCSVWKVMTDVEFLLHQLGTRPGADAAAVEALRSDLRLGQSMMIEFFQAHQEDPTRLRPESYWYGQEYSYLTRDLIDLTVGLADRANRLDRAAKAGDDTGIRELTPPPLLAGRPAGRFLEYPHVGRQAELSSLRRRWRFGRWVKASAKLGWRKKRLAEEDLEDRRRQELAWQACLEWGRATLQVFGIQVRIQIDPEFSAVARDIALGSGKQKVLFLPTHQSLLDHAVMYYVLQRPEVLAAMGWQRPMPCVILARTGLARAGIRIGTWNITQFGISSDTFDRLMEEVDGYVMLERSGATGHTTPRIAGALEERPGIIYPMATTAAFDNQCFPLQHAMFAHLPQDVVMIPVAFRGIHSLWPKCPKGNIRINPGVVEAVISPPMLGETTLLPRRRSLRVQAEAAALFQAFHIATLLNPDERDAPQEASRV